MTELGLKSFHEHYNIIGYYDPGDAQQPRLASVVSMENN